jgi:amino acid adenylation domain-containing protein
MGYESEAILFSNVFNNTFCSILGERVQKQGEKKLFNYRNSDTEVHSISFYELEQASKAIASVLISEKLYNERALLLYPSGLEYVEGLFGCFYSQVIAVPVYPPDPLRLVRTLPRLVSIMKDSDAKVILTTQEIFNGLFEKREDKSLNEFWALLPPTNYSQQDQPYLKINRHNDKVIYWLITDLIPSDFASHYTSRSISSDSIAYLQYTSGSTGNPNGVVLTHKNIVENSKAIRIGFGVHDYTHNVEWLPMYHDMGLVGALLQPIYSGIECTLMSPLYFLERPFRWLKIISSIPEEFGVVAGGPNFAYDLCNRRVSDEQVLTLDLNRWYNAFNGAEPVNAETLNTFSKKFAPAGFRYSAFFPCYGLAEATVYVSGGPVADTPRVLNLNKVSLEKNKVELSDREDESIKKIVGCGKAIIDEKILIVNPENLCSVKEDEIGEIWVSSPGVSSGYYNQEKNSKDIFQAYTSDTKEGPFLRTGDLGFIKDNELFVTGRLKDLLIIRGSNHYPQDLEYTVEKCTDTVRESFGAAFQVEIDGQDEVVIVYEIKPRKEINWEEVAQEIRRSVSESHELKVYEIAFIKAKTIPKTSSGKIQRRAAKQLYLNNELEIIYKSKYSADTQFVGSKEKSERILTKPISKIFNKEDENSILNFLKEQIAFHQKMTIEQISESSSLYDFGLDSLTAVEIKADLENELGVEIPLTILFSNDSVKSLAQKVIEIIRSDFTKSSRDFSRAEDVVEFALSYGQKALWLINQTDSQNSAYNVFFAVRILSEADFNSIKTSLSYLLNRHPSLRTNFIYKNGEPLQVVSQKTDPDFKVIELEDEISEKALTKISREAHRPFDLENDQLLRVRLYKHKDLGTIMLFCFHHIIVDLWSITVLMNELNEVYPFIKTTGKIPEINKHPAEYFDFTKWQSEYLKSDRAKKAEASFIENIGSDFSPLELASDKIRPSVMSLKGRTINFDLPESLSNELRDSARNQKVTLFTLLCSAFQLLLNKYTGRESIVIGTAASGRTKSFFNEVVGYFVNSVPIKAEFKYDLSFEKFLDTNHKNILKALDNQDYPFPLLVEKVQPERNTAFSPIFNVMFVLERPHISLSEQFTSFIFGSEKVKMDFAGMQIESFPLEQEISQFDLTLIIVDKPGALSCSIQFSDELFFEESIRILQNHFVHLLKEIRANPKLKLSELNLLDDLQKKILIDRNSTSKQEFKPELLSDLFHESVLRFPKKTAVKFDDREYTYEQLDSLSGSIALQLKIYGVKPETRVGLYINRSLEMIPGILGIIKAGGVYVPLDPEYPEERIKYMIEDSGIRTILTLTNLNQNLNFGKLNLVNIDKISVDPSVVITNECSPENTAYIIYTSGTTGLPKGVMVSHKAASQHLRSIRDHYRISENDNVLQFASLNFDASIEQIFTSLISGAVLYPRSERIWNAEEFSEFIKMHSINVINIPPAYWNLITNHWHDNTEISVADKLKLVIIGGDVMSFDTLIKWQKLPNNSARLINAYGPTECVITPLSFDIPDDFSIRQDFQRIPIGCPNAERSVYILDKNNNLLPPGVPGELYIGGVIASGYQNFPEATEERFIKNPFSSKPDEFIYKTGDLCRMNSDYSIEFIGRIDQQVKIRGLRIEPGEIEHYLSQHDSVAKVVVSTFNDQNENKAIAAYIELKMNVKNLDEEMRKFLSDKIPKYMIPSVFILMDKLPMTPGGKPDYRALPKPEQTSFLSGYVPPEDEIEIQLAGMMKELLNVDQVGVYDSFFRLGGHSLLAAQLLSKVKDEFGVEIKLKDFFRKPDISNLSELILEEKLNTVNDDELEKLLNEVKELKN